MTKVAVLCEGETEQRFCRRLFHEVLGGTCHIDTEKLRGKQGSRYIQVSYHHATEGYEYLIHLFDCGGGGTESVISAVEELYKKFILQERYDFVVGIQDVFPQPRRRADSMATKFRQRIPTTPIPGNPGSVFLILSIMEIEAWFLAEHTHFAGIDSSLSAGRILNEMRFDPSSDDMQLRDHPAEDLRQIYQLAGKHYEIRQTVNALDMCRVYMELPDRYPPLSQLTQVVDLVHAAERKMS